MYLELCIGVNNHRQDIVFESTPQVYFSYAKCLWLLKYNRVGEASSFCGSGQTSRSIFEAHKRFNIFYCIALLQYCIVKLSNDCSNYYKVDVTT